MRKKWIALLMTVFMTASLVACGAKQEERIRLTVWAPSEDQSEENGNWLKTMCEKFDEEHPEWEIDFTYGVCAEGEAKATVTQDVEAAADVYMFANDNLTDLIASNAIARLGGSTEEYVRSNMSRAVVDSVTVDDALYGIPFTTNTWFMYYNKSQLNETDVQSMESMLEKGRVAFPVTDSWYLASFYVANGCTLFNNNNEEEAGIDFGGDKAAAVTEYLVNLVKNPNFVNDSSGEGLAGMANGSVVAMFSGSWDYGNVAKAIGEENVGATQLPTIHVDGKDKSLKAFFGSKAIGVNPHCDNLEVAVALAAYLGGEEAQKAHYDMRNILPTNAAVLQDPAIATDVVAIATDACIANTSIMQPYCQAMNNYWAPAENFGMSVISGEVTLENAAEKTETFNKALNTSVAE